MDVRMPSGDIANRRIVVPDRLVSKAIKAIRAQYGPIETAPVYHVDQTAIYWVAP